LFALAPPPFLQHPSPGRFGLKPLQIKQGFNVVGTLETEA
jgi:hypothetical protein